MAADKDLEQQYGRAMEEHGFLPDPENRRYGSMGLCWRHSSQQGGGFSGPTGSRISIPSRSMISFSMRISCWSSIGRRVSVSPGMNPFPGRSSPPAAVLFQAVSKVLSEDGNHTGRSSTGRSPSFPLAWRSPRLTTGIICAASFPRSIKACWSLFKRWIRQNTSRNGAALEAGARLPGGGASRPSVL